MVRVGFSFFDGGVRLWFGLRVPPEADELSTANNVLLLAQKDIVLNRSHGEIYICAAERVGVGGDN